MRGLYFSEYHKFPATLKELVDDGFIGEEGLKDGWDNDYNYETIGEKCDDYNLSSSGKDGVKGTVDDISLN